MWPNAGSNGHHVDAGSCVRTSQIVAAVGDEVIHVGERGDDPRTRGAQLVRRRERDHDTRAGDHRALHVRLVVVERRDAGVRMKRADAEHADVGALGAERLDGSSADATGGALVTTVPS